MRYLPHPAIRAFSVTAKSRIVRRMAYLRRIDGNGCARGVCPGGRTLFGRMDSCDVRIADPHIGGVHCIVTFLPGADGRSGVWVVRDQGSLNGTYVNGERLQSGVDKVLQVDDHLRLGPDEVWQVVDLAPPAPVAFHPGSGALLVADGTHLRAADGTTVPFALRERNGRWSTTGADGRRAPVKDGDTLPIADGTWRLYLPTSPLDVTLTQVDPTNARGLHLVLQWTEREAVLGATLFRDGVRFPLDVHADGRALQFLGILASRRAAELEAGETLADAGWISYAELMRRLKLTRGGLGTLIHRARAIFGEAGVTHPRQVVITGSPAMNGVRLDGCESYLFIVSPA